MKDLSDYILNLCHERRVDPQSQLCKLGIDRGRQHLKLGLSVIELCPENEGEIEGDFNFEDDA